MYDVLSLVLASTVPLGVLAAVYVVSDDPGRRDRALQLIRLLTRR